MSTRLPIVDSGILTINERSENRGKSAKERRKAQRKRLPEWFKTSLPTGSAQSNFNKTKSNVHEHGLHTVCEEARCPNVHDCWARGTATFMIAGEVCTRGCGFDSQVDHSRVLPQSRSEKWCMLGVHGRLQLRTPQRSVAAVKHKLPPFVPCEVFVLDDLRLLLR